jgi:biotin synthase
VPNERVVRSTRASTDSTVRLRTPIRLTRSPQESQTNPGPIELPASPSASEARNWLRAASDALLEEHRILEPAELGRLAVLPDESVSSLAALAHEVRLEWCGSAVEVEGILSAKTGGCPEDCHFCSQSAKFSSPVAATAFLSEDEVLSAAQETAKLGASEFCIVLAVRGPDERILSNILSLVPVVKERTGLNVAVSAGILTPDQAKRLAEGGVHRYNHNLETARSFFPRVVTTHTWDERAETCKLVVDNGMELCCGALLGMGESDAQRVELITQLQQVGPAEVPLNFLNPRPGTPLGDRHVVEAWDAIRWIAIFRLGLPGVILRYAGGREVTLRDLQAMGLTSGINALIVGNYLTTLGRPAEDDLRMLSDLRMPVGALSSVI